MNAAADLVRKHLLTVADFDRMGETGVLDSDVRVELIEGEIFDMPPIGSPHAGIVDLLNEAFVLASSGRAILRTQNPIVLGDYSKPLPDLALLRRRGDFYVNSLPTADDVLLVVEVAHSSLHHDKHVKRLAYARNVLPEYWFVDVEGRRTTVYRAPSEGDYRESFVAEPGSLALVALPEVSLDPTLPFA